MKIVQINTVPNLSTGNVMMRNHERYLSEGHKSWVMWGRGRNAEKPDELYYGSKLGVYFDVLKTRLFGHPGFYSKHATKKLIRKLDEINPDLVHLHNLHGYHINIQLLFNWLKEHSCKVQWTLHDCWAFTGHCSHFTYVKFNQWKNQCSKSYNCPQTRQGFCILLEPSSQSTTVQYSITKIILNSYSFFESFIYLYWDKVVLFKDSKTFYDIAKYDYWNFRIKVNLC